MQTASVVRRSRLYPANDLQCSRSFAKLAQINQFNIRIYSWLEQPVYLRNWSLSSLQKKETTVCAVQYNPTRYFFQYKYFCLKLYRDKVKSKIKVFKTLHRCT